MTSAAELIREGHLSEALFALQKEIREHPEDPNRRIFLFQLDCVLGHLEKALTQLQVVATLDADAMVMAQVFRPVIACELLRREVFMGKRSALIFGEPTEWIGLLVQACSLLAQGKFQAASPLRDKAFELAPANTGLVNGRPFQWIADADSRLGPLIEIILEGKYYWVPFSRIAKVEIAEPKNLRDVVWLPAQLTWTNGGVAKGHIPVRYPETDASDDEGLKLARKTVWDEPAPGCFIGLGQRMLATDTGEYPLLDCRTIEFKAV